MLLLDACTLAPSVPHHRYPRRVEMTMASRYVGRMPVTANQVAAAIRDQLPDARGAKLDRLLYYVQGHHLALFGRQAYDAVVVAGAEGPEVEDFEDQHLTHVRGVLDQPLLNVVLIVTTRYGGLTTGDLNRLTTAETPWRVTPQREPIPGDVLAAFFTDAGALESFGDDPEGDDPEHQRRIRQEVKRIQDQATGKPDDFEELLSEVAGRARR